MLGSCQLMGVDFAFPDVCKTPPAMLPITYPNVALGPTAIPNAVTILVDGGPAHNIATATPFSNGDNAGIGTGLISNRVMSTKRDVTGSFTSLVNGTPWTRMTSITTQNGCNMVGMRIVPSQPKVVVLAP